MCLVAQFGKWLIGIIIFFSWPTFFYVNIQRKKALLGSAKILSQGLLFIFKELQRVAGSYLANSRGFSVAHDSILGQFTMSRIFTPVDCLDFCNQILASHADLTFSDRYAKFGKGQFKSTS